MKLSAAKRIVFWIALVLAVVAVLMALEILLPASILGIDAVWVAIASFVLLALGNVLKGF